MDFDPILKLPGLESDSILNTVLHQAGKQEQAQMLTLAGVVIVLLMVVQLINQLFTAVRTVFRIY